MLCVRDRVVNTMRAGGASFRRPKFPCNISQCRRQCAEALVRRTVAHPCHGRAEFCGMRPQCTRPCLPTFALCIACGKRQPKQSCGKDSLSPSTGGLSPVLQPRTITAEATRPPRSPQSCWQWWLCRYWRHSAPRHLRSSRTGARRSGSTPPGPRPRCRWYWRR
jgi:hypothetical protein